MTELHTGDIVTFTGEYRPLTWRERIVNVWRWLRRRQPIERRLQEYVIVDSVDL